MMNIYLSSLLYTKTGYNDDEYICLVYGYTGLANFSITLVNVYCGKNCISRLMILHKLQALTP